MQPNRSWKSTAVFLVIALMVNLLPVGAFERTPVRAEGEIPEPPFTLSPDLPFPADLAGTGELIRAVTLYSGRNEHGALHVVQIPWSPRFPDRVVTTATFVSGAGESIVVSRDSFTGDVVAYLPGGAISIRKTGGDQWEIAATTPDGVVRTANVRYDGRSVPDEDTPSATSAMSAVLEPSSRAIKSFSDYGVEARILGDLKHPSGDSLSAQGKWVFSCVMGIASFVGGFVTLGTCWTIVGCGLGIAGVIGGGVAIGENCGGFMP